MPISKHTRKGKVRPRNNIKNGGYPSIKRSTAWFLTDRIKSGAINFNTSDIKRIMKDGF